MVPAGHTYQCIDNLKHTAAEFTTSQIPRTDKHAFLEMRHEDCCAQIFDPEWELRMFCEP
jgi:hypothetical protein